MTGAFPLEAASPAPLVPASRVSLQPLLSLLLRCQEGWPESTGASASPTLNPTHGNRRALLTCGPAQLTLQSSQKWPGSDLAPLSQPGSWLGAGGLQEKLLAESLHGLVLGAFRAGGGGIWGPQWEWVAGQQGPGGAEEKGACWLRGQGSSTLLPAHMVAGAAGGGRAPFRNNVAQQE